MKRNSLANVASACALCRASDLSAATLYWNAAHSAMKTHAIPLLLFCLLSRTAFGGPDAGFKPLFNGKDLSGWTMLPGKPPAFSVAEGVIETRPRGGSDLFTTGRFGNFVLRFEYLLSDVGNSGVLIRCDPNDPWRTGVEVQLLAPWTPHRDDLHCTASLYGIVAVTNRPDETTGIWHQMEIACDRKAITVSVDGKLATAANADQAAGLKDKLLSGAIGFQSNHSKEGEFARFRKVEVKDLDAEPAYVQAGFFDADARVRTQAREAAAALGAAMVGPLAGLMGGSDVAARTGARQALFDIAAAASAPQAPAEGRRAVARAFESALRVKPPEPTANYLEWLLGMVEH